MNKRGNNHVSPLERELKCYLFINCQTVNVAVTVKDLNQGMYYITIIEKAINYKIKCSIVDYSGYFPKVLYSQEENEQ